jgi:hypothetical protein
VKHANIVSALQHLAPDAQYVILDEQIIWECDLPQPSDAEIERVISLIENKLKRQNGYPPIGDQLDSLFHAGVFPEEMATKLQAVKDAYPKPSETE